MNITAISIASGALACIGLLVYAVWRFSSKATEKSRQIAEIMGFTPVSADAGLNAKIGDLYQHPEVKSRYELQQVARREFTEGRMYLFNLVDVSYDDTTWQATQSVAVISSGLDLPHFVLTPKAGMGDWASALADRAITWAVTRYGQVVSFPEYPEFERQYVVTSVTPEDAHRFFDEEMIRQLAETRFYCIHARGDLFTFTEMDPQAGRSRPELDVLSRRMDRAMNIFRLFQASSRPVASV